MGVEVLPEVRSRRLEVDYFSAAGQWFAFIRRNTELQVVALRNPKGLAKSETSI